MMFLARLTLLVAVFLTVSTAITAVVLAWPARAVATAIEDPPRAGKDDLAGRVIDKAGTAVADVQVWAVGGHMVEPVTIATATTDRQGRFVLPGAWAHNAVKAFGDERLGLLAARRDGRVGWLANYGRDEFVRQGGEIELQPVSEVRGRLTIKTAARSGAPPSPPRSSGSQPSSDSVDRRGWSPKRPRLHDRNGRRWFFRPRRNPSGLAGGGQDHAQGREPTRISCNTAHSWNLTLDHRLGRIEGRLKPTDARAFTGQIETLRLVRRTARYGGTRPRHASLQRRHGGLPGRLVPVRRPASGPLRVGAPPRMMPPLSRQPSAASRSPRTAWSRSSTARTAGDHHRPGTFNPPDRQGASRTFPVACYHMESVYLKVMAGHGPDRRRGAILGPAPAGHGPHRGPGIAKSYLGPIPEEYPDLEVKADSCLRPEAHTPRFGLDGIVVDQAGHPISSARSTSCSPPARDGPVARSRRDGTRRDVPPRPARSRRQGGALGPIR